MIACVIRPVGRRRDGASRSWCMAHRANATGKHGIQLARCVAADRAPLRGADVLDLEIAKYLGGVSVTALFPPVYDTTGLLADRGIHVRARPADIERAGRGNGNDSGGISCSIRGGDSSDGGDALDRVSEAVRVVDPAKLPHAESLLISAMDAIYYRVAESLDRNVIYLECTYCKYPHLDEDWYGVHAHRSHLCSGCGKHFRASIGGIGNPVAKVVDAYGASGARRARAADSELVICQSDYPGGIRIWGSNPALLWTATEPEEIGIRVQAFDGNARTPRIDARFARVQVDGIALDREWLNLLMAQRALPYLAGRVVSVACQACGKEHCDEGESAFTLHASHACEHCGAHIRREGRKRSAIANPLVETLLRLSVSRKVHDGSLDLEAKTGRP